MHLLGTCHHVPCNPSLVAAAAQAIGPDCIAVEASATRLGVMSKAAKDPGMQQVLARLCAFPLDQCSLVSPQRGLSGCGSKGNRSCDYAIESYAGRYTGSCIERRVAHS